ncbi:RusA family crossover junction endodeoxyribonuclease [Nannocystaceae bacterium ST9]
MTDDKLITDLERFERGEIPSVFGELCVQLPRAPVSQQAKREKKEGLTRDLRDALAKYQFFLTGDVQLELEWLVHERVRYESDEGADVDNILKPTLDALSGPKGILIDDCQVQSVASHWIDWNCDMQQLNIRLRHAPDAFMSRVPMALVDLGRNLYMPLDTSLSNPVRAVIVTALRKQIELRDNLEALGADFSMSRAIMSIQRPFHRSRLGTGFRLGSLEQYCDGTIPMTPKFTSGKD